MPQSDEEHLSAAIDWLHRSQDITGCGGSAAYYSLLTGWSGPYPETSGYIVPTLYDYAEYADSREARDRAKKMALWLLDTQLDSGAFPSGVAPDSNADPSVFNTGQILFGLVRAYEETDDERYISAAVEAANWLVAVQHEDGYWDQYDYRGEVHTYCSRVAWALLEVEQQIGEDSFHRAAINHLDWTLSNQTADYWFNNAAFSPEETPFLHTIAYTVRGILECGILLDNDTYLNAAKGTADRLMNLQKESKVLAGAYSKTWNPANFNCLTGNAQTALIWHRLADHYDDERYLTAADREIEFLKTHHILNKPAPLYGGLTGSVPVWGKYLRLRVPNWAVKFFIDCILYRIDS